VWFIPLLHVQEVSDLNPGQEIDCGIKTCQLLSNYIEGIMPEMCINKMTDL
jgi:hypothetical protein